MPKGKYSTHVQPRIQFTLEPELHARIVAYHQAVDPNRFAVETIRELLWIAVNAGDTSTGVAAAARVTGKKQAFSYVLSEVSQALRTLEIRTRQLASEADANTLAEAQMAARGASFSIE